MRFALFTSARRLSRQLLPCLALAAWLLAAPAWADKSLDQLPAITTPAGTDLYYCLQGTTDYKCTLDQVRAWSSVAITGGDIDGTSVDATTLTTTGNAGIGLSLPLNRLDVEGGAVIGAGYAGAYSSPTNGMLIEGALGIGTTSVDDTEYALDIIKNNTNDHTRPLRTVGWSIATSAGSYNVFGFMSDVGNSRADSGITNSGQVTGAVYNARLLGTHAGTISTQNGVSGNAGIFSASSGAVVTTARAGYFEVRNNQAGATITNGYALYLKNDETAGTMTNRFDLYASSANAANYFAGSVGIGTTSPAASAKLEISSTTGAFLNARMTTTQRDALTAVDGMQIYNTTTNKLQVRAGGAWVDLH